ncbi:MAG: COQ9 family protein [Pseudomonadota bacterium]
MKEDTVTVQDKILLAALDDVPFDGWSWEGVQSAAEKAGYKSEMADAVFIEKLNDVLIHFADWADRKMLERLKDFSPEEIRTRDRVAKAVELRLQILQPHKDSVKASAGYWARPLRKFDAAKLVWRTADHIWDWAGDTATDYNRYTKRILLSGVITSTVLFWFQDESDDMRDTIAFLHRRIDNVLMIGKAASQLKSFVPNKKEQASG